MKKIYFLFAMLTYQVGFSQTGVLNAVNDTLILYPKDSISKASILFTGNDMTPVNNQLSIDTVFYNGTNFLSFQKIISTNWSRINYKAYSGFAGWDSIQYIVKTTSPPIMIDTAMIYIFVAQKNHEFIDLNNIKARVGLNSTFSNIVDGIAGFEVPKGSGRNTIFASNAWVAGKNNNTVYANVETFGNFATSTSVSNLSGPISTNYPTFEFSLKWDRVWKVTNADLQYHISNWFFPGYQPPQVFLDWPAHGDTTNGQAFYLAPFIDKNNDGIYNPYDGDYPKFKGQQAIYFIRNDSRVQRNQYPMRSEIHGIAYAYDCPSDSAINHTVFLDVTIYNRSNKTYDSTYVGLFADFDIGNFSDDYVGCDVDRSTFYGYNGDPFDENNGPAIGYGAYIPYQGVTFLKGAKQDDDGVDNAFGIASYETINGTGFGDGISDNEYWGMEHFTYYNQLAQFPGDGDPTNDIQHYYYLTGKWRDGISFTYGGNGHPPYSGGTVPAKYLFPDVSDTYSYGTGGVAQAPWGEYNAFGSTGNTPADRRGMGSTGPFTLAPQQSIELTVAYVFGRDYSTQGNVAGLTVMQERVDSIRSYFADGFKSVCGGLINGINDGKEKINPLKVYPNPFTNEFTIEYKAENQFTQLEVYNLMGVKVAEQQLNSFITQVNLSGISTGIYIVIIRDGNKKLHHKMVKQ